MRPIPGDRVIIIEDAFDQSPPLCEATKGSLARALSYEEYCEYYSKATYFLYPPIYVKQWMEKFEQYPFIFEDIVPYDSAGDIANLYVGKVIVLSDKFFKHHKA